MSLKTAGVHFKSGKSGQFIGCTLNHFEESNRWYLGSLIVSSKLGKANQDQSFLNWIDENSIENIVLDISSLELNGVMTASELTLLEDIVLISPEDTTVATCNPPRAEAEPEVEELEEGEESETSVDSSDGDEKEKDGDEKGEASE